jgi:hypothetical protein
MSKLENILGTTGMVAVIGHTAISFIWSNDLGVIVDPSARIASMVMALVAIGAGAGLMITIFRARRRLAF